jgi:hypothetical protein
MVVGWFGSRKNEGFANLKGPKLRISLCTRLELGIPASILEIASVADAQLNRGDYQSLIHAGINNVEVVATTSDEDLLHVLADNEDKVKILRAIVIHTYVSINRMMSNFHRFHHTRVRCNLLLQGQSSDTNV